MKLFLCNDCVSNRNTLIFNSYNDYSYYLLTFFDGNSKISKFKKFNPTNLTNVEVQISHILKLLCNYHINKSDYNTTTAKHYEKERNRIQQHLQLSHVYHTSDQLSLYQYPNYKILLMTQHEILIQSTTCCH